MDSAKLMRSVVSCKPMAVAAAGVCMCVMLREASAYQLLLPLNPAASPACCMAVGFAGPQRRVGVQTGLDLGLTKEKIKEQIHYLL